VIGGAGFIGSHLVDELLRDPGIQRVTVYDNFTSGRRWHLDEASGDPRFELVTGDVKDLDLLTKTVSGHERVVHLASNPDIAKAMTDPTVDFDEGTLLTHHVVEAARRSGVERVLYASGSGVYGDLGEVEIDEDFGPLIPVSTYGASKLAGEALISSYCHMFGLSACVFRFGNVIGAHQTHGVGYDFVRRLLEDPSTLTILGNGSQSKPYIHVDDVVSAVLTADDRYERPFGVFNVAPGDHLSVKEIADLAVETVLGPGASVEYRFGREDRGWKGDVPVVRLNTDRIRSLGWTNRRSGRQAMKAALESMTREARDGKFGAAASRL
jgi:UDP-glucose 4-epimerase